MRARATTKPPACSCGEAAAFGRAALACLAAALVLAVPDIAQASTDTTFDAENRQFGLTPVRGVRLNRAKKTRRPLRQVLPQAAWTCTGN